MTNILDKWTLAGRNYVVTGGSKGIGRAVVDTLLAHGAMTVIFCSRSDASSVVEELQGSYPKAKILHVACDLTEESGRQHLLAAAKASFSVLHGLVNNLGMNIRKSMIDQTADEFTQIMRTNVDTAYFTSKLFVEMLGQGSTIVNVSSAAGVQSSGTGIAYGMSKAALNHLTRSLACEWAQRGIRVNAIAPWMTMTPMLEDALKDSSNAKAAMDKVYTWTPMHRIAKAEEIAAPVVFLSMPASSYITGQVLGIDGGLTAQGFDGPCVTP